MVLTWNSGTYRVYVDGVERATGTYSALNAINPSADIGNNGNSAGRDQDLVGSIDEFRLSRVERSADWITTSYTNQNDPSSFYTVSAEYAADQLCIALPISLTDFYAQKQANNQVLLKWITASEINNDYFSISRSVDGFKWIELATIKGNGNSSKTQEYHYLDVRAKNGVNYYQLTQIDYDGKSETFSPIYVEINRSTADIYPNPTINKIVFNQLKSNDPIRLFDIHGKEVSDHIQIKKINSTTVELNISLLPNGLYFIQQDENSYKFLKSTD